MPMFIRTSALFALFILAASCSQNDDANFQAPNFPTGPGTVFSVNTVSFTTADNVLVSARFGQNTSSGASPVVILMHDIRFNGGIEWELAGFGLEMVESLLEEGYLVLIIDSRGFGLTPLPDGRTSASLLVGDLENLHIEVKAALTWLRTQPSADVSRVGIMGSGMGGNAAFVSMGAYPDELRAGIALSPGIYNLSTGESLGLGAGLPSFEPHSMLFIASQGDLIPVNQTQAVAAATLAASLHEITAEPKQLETRPADLHGSLLLQDPVVSEAVLAWLKANL